MERRFVAVNGRQVHYARAGHASGPAVVLLHASPGDWSPLRGLAAELARSCAVYALDTPGHGGSDPLPVPDPGMADYGDALGDTLAALGLRRAHLYGTHTGAKIALSLAVSRPDAVASLVLDGVGVSTPEERADQLARYLPPVVPRGDGGHLVAAWHQVRNMFLYWPWYDERAAARLTAPPPSADYLHDLTVGLLEAGEHYPLAYRAAFTCDPVPLLARLDVPALILASPSDPLHAHLSRLPGHLRVETTAADPAALAARVRAHVVAAGGEAAGDPVPGAVSGIVRSYVSTRLGQLLVRRAGADGGRPLVVLPPAPASGGAVTGILAEAGERRPVVAVDLPGTGCSDLAGPADLPELAGAVGDALDALGLDAVDLYGTGAGAALAVAVARSRPGLVRALALAGLPALTPAEARSRTPALDPDEHGTHLLKAWHLVRDGGLRTRLPELPELHRRTLDVARSWRTYGHVFRAAAEPAGEPPVPVFAAEPVWDPFTATSVRAASGAYGGGVTSLLHALTP